MAPAVIPMALPVTIMAMADNQTAGASVDVQTKTVLVGGLGIVQSVAYLAGLEKLYTSELSFGASPARTKNPQGSEQSTIFDVTTGGQQSVAVFGDDIPKMIAYAGADGKEYLLLAGRTSGSIRRLDPGTGTSVEVGSGFNGPNALVVDPGTGALLVAEADRVSMLSAFQVNLGLTGAGLAQVETPVGARTLVAGVFPTGIAVDPCNGDVYISQASTGEVLKIDRLTGEVTVLASDLFDPTHLLVISRSGISCPVSTHLLTVENHLSEPQTAALEGQIRLIVPSTGSLVVWLPFAGIPVADLTLLPGSNLGSSSVLVGETGQVSQVEVVDRYEPRPINPPEVNPCLGVVNIEDPVLEEAIREQLGLTAGLPGGGPPPITCEQARGLTFLRSEDVQTLQGLQAFPNLERLFLDRGFIADAGPLAALKKLTRLSMFLNQVEDIGPLSGLKQLTSLTLQNNAITDLAPVAGLTRLVQLSVTNNPIAENHMALSNLTNLEALFAANAGFSDVTPLAGLNQLIILFLSVNSIADISPLAGLTKLESLLLDGNQIADTSTLAELDQLRTLILDSNQVSDISSLTGLTQLRTLRMFLNQVSDISPLSGLTQLEHLELGRNQITDLGPVSGLHQLIELRAFNNQIVDISPVAGLTLLRQIDFALNQIINIPLAGLTELQQILLSGNQIADIAPLVANPGVGEGDVIDLNVNPLDSRDCANIATLIGRGANVQHEVDCP